MSLNNKLRKLQKKINMINFSGVSQQDRERLAELEALDFNSEKYDFLEHVSLYRKVNKKSYEEMISDL